jgi:hypothetical protein
MNPDRAEAQLRAGPRALKRNYEPRLALKRYYEPRLALKRNYKPGFLLQPIADEYISSPKIGMGILRAI